MPELDKRLTETSPSTADVTRARNAALTIEEFESRESVAELATRWNALRTRCGSSSPFTEFEWYWNALQTAARHKAPLVLILRSDGHDIALAPFVYHRVSQWGISLNYLEFVDNPHTTYQSILSQCSLDEVLHALAGYLRQKWGTRYILDLNEVRLSDAERSVFPEPGIQKEFLIDWIEKPWSRYVLLGDSFDELVQSLKKKTQKEFRRKAHRLETQGHVELVRVSGDDEIHRHLDQFFDLYGRTWKSPEREIEFYHKLCPYFAGENRLLFYALTLDSRPIAYLICVRGGDTVYGIKITYDVDSADFSPGVLLVYESIRDMFDIGGIREFDIGRGDEQFKREWTSTAHRQDRIMLFPRCTLWCAVDILRNRMIPRLKRQRLLGKLYTALRHG